MGGEIIHPELIDAGRHVDERGALTFFNGLSLEAVKRFYVIEAFNTETIRAWQGHKKERKWFHVTEGAFKVVLVKPDSWDEPSQDLRYEEFMLDHKKAQVLAVPSGYATGFKALDKKSKLLVFSDFSLEESMEDDFRFDKNLWYKW